MAISASKLKEAIREAMLYSDEWDAKDAAKRAMHLAEYPYMEMHVRDARKTDRLNNFVGFLGCLVSRDDPTLGQALKDFSSRVVLGYEPGQPVDNDTPAAAANSGSATNHQE